MSNSSTNRILLIEDDERIRSSMQMALEDEGYEVAGTPTAEEGLELFAAATPDVVLIDVFLPGMDGFEFCRLLRRTSGVPIIMVTARSDSQDVITGLEAGADDYVTKPFVTKELAARIRSLLRRVHTHEGPPATLVIGDLEIAQEAGEVRRASQPVHLTRTEFRLLCELAGSPGRVFSREQLLERVWGYDYFGDGRLVDVHMRRLRTKIEPDPANPVVVVTVRGLGYKIVP